MIDRRPGESPTLECRRDASETVDRQRRYTQITECLKERPNQTAKELAVMMMEKGYALTSERNITAPRLTEMGKKGTVEPVWKKACSYTGRMVTVWALRG